MEGQSIGYFQADTKTIRQVFDGTNYYRVPDYQRSYRWEDEHVEKLWDDIKAAFDSRDSNYFLGPTIFAKGGEPPYLDVVDGQQRLTTLTILFAVLRDFFLDGADLPTQRAVKNCIQSLVNEQFRLRLITQSNDQNQFEAEILNRVTLPGQRTAARSSRFLNAAWILRDRVRSEFPPEAAPAVAGFVNYLLDNVLLICVLSSDLASSVKLFQTLNARGLDLDNSDLIKSYLYGKCGNQEERRAFLDTWKEVTVIGEKLPTNESLDNLLTYYMHYLTAKKATKTLFEEISQVCASRKPGEVVYDFKQLVEGFGHVINSKLKAVFGLRYLRDQITWKSVLAAAEKEHCGDLESLSKELQRFYYCYWVAGHNAAKVRDAALSLIGLIKQHAAVEQLTESVERKMQNDNVRERAADSLKADTYGSPWLKRVLMLVEYSLEDYSKAAFVNLDREVHVDHILPREWEQHTDWKTHWTKEEANTWLNKIGNLTLISGSKNEAASNRPFSEKRRIYKGDRGDGVTGFLISREVSEHELWTPEHALARQKKMTERLARILGFN